MSGHSKWNNIKNRKGAVDAQKAVQFSLAAKNIRLAVKQGKSGEPQLNAALRLALEKARSVNMPKDKIQRAIDAGLGKRDGRSIQEIVYEGFGPGGVGLMIVANTDNPQRTSAEIKFILSRAGGSLGGPGSAQYLFSKQGDEFIPTMPLELTDQAVIDKIEALIEACLQNEDVEDIYYAATWPNESSSAE